MFDHQKKIGYIRIVSFGRDTFRDLREAMKELDKQHLRGLVLDLRFNPGGLLASAIEVADLFLSEGEIVSTAGRNSPKRSWSARKPETYEGFPMVVLVNRYSASASEIVSAALQDHKRALVIGERTWGKGSVQNVIELQDGKSALKLTTASYRRPSGHNIHRFPDSKESDIWGVMPDAGYEIKLPDAELGRLVADRHDRDILLINHSVPQAEGAKADGEKPSGEAKPSAEESDASQAGKAKPDAAKKETTDTGETKTADSAAEASGKVIDRQLQQALDYLSGELAKAK
jgi:carboxyl-terminal processing protease